jgi:UDP-GlcNAc:undecaprenyl-phosphate GlcNAc-1-phosphate transferase
LGHLAEPLTVLGIVFLINVVNFSDGVDGLAAGVGAIAASAFVVIAFDLDKANAAVLAAIVAGAALGFLVHNFHPASVFMGDCGSNLLGYLLGCVIVEGTLKTNALIALVGPLVVLAVPFLDTGFVVAKRIKYRRPVYKADRWHFHHRMANIGFSQRRTVLYLYAWMLMMAGIAIALRFIPYSHPNGELRPGWSLIMGALLALWLAASVYLVYVLEIFKFRRLAARRLRRVRPEASEAEVDADVTGRLETGEWQAVTGSGDGRPPAQDDVPSPSAVDGPHPDPAQRVH